MSNTLSTTRSPSVPLHYGLWAVQILLAFAFFAAGLMKATAPIETLAQNMPWVGYSPAALVRFVGVSEVLGAIGLVVPAATRIAPALTPIAAAALAFVMLLAGGMHGMHGEWSALPVNAVIGGLAAFVAWGRLVGAPIAPR